MPDSCLICKQFKQSGISLHRFPSTKTHPTRRKQWLKALNLKESDISHHHRICMRHFVNQDPTQIPTLHLGKKFRSPKKTGTERSQRAVRRSAATVSKNRGPERRLSFSPSVSPKPVGSTSVSPSPNNVSLNLMSSEEEEPSRMLSTPIGESLLSDSEYSVHELPSEHSSLSSMDITQTSTNYSSVIQTALIARIETLESENKQLQCQLKSKKMAFRIENVAHDDGLIKFYTGFASYEQLIHFYELLGPAVNHLRYWGDKGTARKRVRRTKLDPLNQMFLTLVKLRLNLRERDIAYRFEIAVSTVSKYFITWVTFLYHQLTEISWLPTTDQVKKTLPQAFRDKYPDTFAIIDGTEFFIETPCDLQNQSSTWSNYKHHNTAKLLVACTPNGAICYISQLYVGSISDVELTRVSGFIEKLDGKAGVSIMADRGFTIKDQLSAHGVSLNIPPFMEGRTQLPASEIREGRTIASLRIHVERAIGRIKNYGILKGTLPLSMARIADQIVTVCALLVNFQPVLIPSHVTDEELKGVDDYLANLSDSHYDADSSSADEM